MENNHFVDGMVPAMAYVPWQRWGNLFECDEALKKGTIFKVLYKPFMGGAR